MQINKDFLSSENLLPNFVQPSTADPFFLISGFTRERKPQVLPGYHPIWPMTCHLTLLLANALSPTTGWAPAGQLARLLVWSSANEKPQETCVHLNSQMGGQRGRGSTDECVSVCEREGVGVLAWIHKHYWDIFTEEAG